MVRWQLLSMPKHVVQSRWQLLSLPRQVALSGRYFKVGRAFPNLIFVKLGLEKGEGSLWGQRKEKEAWRKKGLHLNNKRVGDRSKA